MEPRRFTTEKDKARREAAARLAVVLAFLVCVGIMLFEAVEYALSFRRESVSFLAAAWETDRVLADAPDGKMNINLASADDLQVIPGVGPKLSQRILAFREEQGGFCFLEEVKDVNGIGEKRFGQIKELFFCPLPTPQPTAAPIPASF